MAYITEDVKNKFGRSAFSYNFEDWGSGHKTAVA
jgi:hypothetical protein